MKTIILDLTGCKNLYDIHDRIRKSFKFPDWYGENWDAFRDLLGIDCDASKVIIKGENTIPKEYEKHIDIMHTVLDDLIEFRKKYDKYIHLPFSYEIEN